MVVFFALVQLGGEIVYYVKYIFDRELAQAVLEITLYFWRPLVKYKPINQGKLNLDFRRQNNK